MLSSKKASISAILEKMLIFLLAKVFVLQEITMHENIQDHNENIQHTGQHFSTFEYAIFIA